MRCTLCGKDVPRKMTSKDHVFPDCLFPPNHKKNLISVRTCKECNNNLSIDEELFLATVIGGRAGATPLGIAVWNKTLSSALDKNRGLAEAIFRQVTPLKIPTPWGDHVVPAIEVDMDRLGHVIAKMVRNLFFIEFKQIIPGEVKIEATCLPLDPELPSTASTKQFVSDMGKLLTRGKRDFEGIVSYRYFRPDPSSTESRWLFLFFHSVAFWASVPQAKPF